MTAKEDLKDVRISVLIHTAVAVLVGFIAQFLGSGYYVLAIAAVIAVVTGHVTQMIVGKRKINWWLANGLVIYFFVVADVWILVANF